MHLRKALFLITKTHLSDPHYFIIIMYIELREKSGKHYVMIRHDDSKDKPVAQFVSTNPVEAYNVAKQYAKQNRCLIRTTTGGIEAPELPPQPAGEG